MVKGVSLYPTSLQGMHSIKYNIMYNTATPTDKLAVIIKLASTHRNMQYGAITPTSQAYLIESLVTRCQLNARSLRYLK